MTAYIENVFTTHLVTALFIASYISKCWDWFSYGRARTVFY